MMDKILERIKEFETIIIHRHVRPDPDAYGSQGGLAKIIQASFPSKKVYVVGDDEATLLYLNKMDVIDEKEYHDALVIVCDTANQERVSDSRYSTGKYLIKIDHHPNEDPYGDLLWVDTNASSTSEMIYEFYLTYKNNGLTLPTEGARLLYAGIVGDTGRFLYPSTTEKTFSYASELIQYPFSRTELYDQMYETPENLIKLNGFIYQNVEIGEGGVAKVIIPKELLEQYQVRPSEASLLISTLGNIQGLIAWAFFIEEADQIRVRLRSKGPVINVVAKKYNGGGHPLAAGASIYSWDKVDQVMDDIKQACKQFLSKK
ncbi:bifunctional oligoribonuclease/PAP phosphatase NrnA [Caldibacillus lycopersici]|uniref:Bifunctional oligoribonuclease/PAP phosphatase NrnA n=1 Tax=Perspicuibacillus lycopersici TaxID=1325689 RepID=A0AAE3IT80_9BACI|nr:bifunctional oligoribonuclease/PAP phosphatase NrnA [Perspicuibacillus lycopersici]MCU9614198.1 bifunctional oligoribonuclease/PAP phosphatase NrnA [Perspicuibacillus lycopersici]